MKNFNYLHLSGYSALGLIVASLAQHWWGGHQAYREAARYPEADTHIAESAAQSESDRLTLARLERQRDESKKAQIHRERQLREQAWAQFYSKPAACTDPSTTIAFSACTDDYIRAKKAFEAQYTPGGAPLTPYQSTLAANSN